MRKLGRDQFGMGIAMLESYVETESLSSHEMGERTGEGELPPAPGGLAGSVFEDNACRLQFITDRV